MGDRADDGSDDVVRLEPEQARQVALRAQLLEPGSASDLLDLVERLTSLPVDLTRAVSPSADHVAWSRLGSSYEPDDLVEALRERELFEHRGFVRPMADLPLHLPEMGPHALYPASRAWLDDNELMRAEVLDALDADGPVRARDIQATAQVAWQSTGWSSNRNVTRMLEILTICGEVVVDGHQGGHRLWNLAERVFPPDVEALPLEEARAAQRRRRLSALGIARERSAQVQGEAVDVGPEGVRAVVDGVRGEWRVDPGLLASLDEQPFVPRTALLSPFDAIVRDRARAEALFGFEYVLEMYKPAAKRRWGYFALPVLHGDRLVGKLDATADRTAGRLFVDALHEDVALSRSARAAIDAEVEALAAWLGLRPDR
jgi:hypothetical protein